MIIAVRSCDLRILGKAELYNAFFQPLLGNCLLARLYKKYVKREDVKSTLQLLKDISVDSEYAIIKDKLIKHVDDQAICAEYAFKSDKKYYPVRIVLFDEPYCTLSDDIPLEDYDNNEGEPFWMRPEYILEHYSQS